MGDTITPGQSLTALLSSNERFTFIFQQDGNLVLYDGQSQVDQTPLWASNTVGAKSCRMQADGNLAIFDASNNAIWTTTLTGQATVG
jgi:hypothetical protein